VRKRATCMIGIILTFLLMIQSCSVSKTKETQVESIKIYYVGWWNDYYLSKTCANLIEMYNQQPQGANMIEIKNAQEILIFNKEFSKIKPKERLDYNDIDVRICCLLYGDSSKVIHSISFETPPLMQIDDKIYDRDEKLFNFIVSNYLPKGYLDISNGPNKR
jgi:hypothetical protein